MSVPTELDMRFRNRAAAESLLDVAYDLTDSPIGTLLVASTRNGLCRIAYDAQPEAVVEELARLHGARVLRSPRPVDDARRELDEYFGGRRRDFGVRLDVERLPGFQRLVLDELARVPYGATATYGSSGGAHRQAEKRESGGRRAESKSAADRAALPSRRRRRRQPGRIRGRTRPQARAARARGCDAHLRTCPRPGGRG